MGTCDLLKARVVVLALGGAISSRLNRYTSLRSYTYTAQHCAPHSQPTVFSTRWADMPAGCHAQCSTVLLIRDHELHADCRRAKNSVMA